MPLAKNNVEKPRCVFYPKLLCSVRAEMQKETVIANIMKPDVKKLPDETQFVAKMADALKGIYEMKWMTLSGFCHLCEKKRLEDWKNHMKFSKFPPAMVQIISCPSCKAEMPANMNYCPKCGTKLEGGSQPGQT
jgi:hypothetical protein